MCIATLRMVAPTALFDLDGTLWDSMPGIVSCLRHALDTVGTPVPDEPLERFIGPPLLVMLGDVGVPDDRLDDGRIAYRDRYHRLGVYEARLYPGVVGLLDALRAGRWHLATATSKGEVATTMMLEHFGLAGYFEVVGAASMDASSHSKIDVIDRALDGLGHPDPSTVTMVGDRHYDIEGGRHFGLRTIAVTWGYGSDEEWTASPADAVARDVGELAALLGV